MGEREPASSDTAADHVPREVSVECTYRCNLRCVHCSVRCLENGRREELSAEEWRDVFEQLERAGTQELTLTGGEPFLRDDWMKLATAASKRFKLIIYTNATTVTPAVAEELTRIAPERVEVSVYGASEETYEAVTGAGQAYDQFRRGLKRLMETGLKIIPKVWVLRENAQEWPRLREHYSEFESFKRGLEVSHRFDGDTSSAQHRATVAQILSVLANENRSHRQSAGEGDRDRPPCGTASGGCIVSAYGDVFPCAFFPKSGGSLRQRPFADIWQCSFFQELRSLTLADLEGCADCDLRPYCRICPGMNYLETGDPRRPAPESCRLARLRRLADHP